MKINQFVLIALSTMITLHHVSTFSLSPWLLALDYLFGMHVSKYYHVLPILNKKYPDLLNSCVVGHRSIHFLHNSRAGYPMYNSYYNIVSAVAQQF